MEILVFTMVGRPAHPVEQPLRGIAKGEAEGKCAGPSNGLAVVRGIEGDLAQIEVFSLRLEAHIEPEAEAKRSHQHPALIDEALR